MYQVMNQPPPLEPVNLLQTDVALREALGRENAEWAEEELTELGALFGAARNNSTRI